VKSELKTTIKYEIKNEIGDGEQQRGGTRIEAKEKEGGRLWPVVAGGARNSVYLYKKMGRQVGIGFCLVRGPASRVDVTRTKNI
jgi:hypothetical protein